jgi:hypothetical protein
MVFHAPHASHLPAHFRWLAPQAVQVKLWSALAMAKV